MESFDRSSRNSRERLPLLTHGSDVWNRVCPFRLAIFSRRFSLDLLPVGFARFSTNSLHFLQIFAPIIISPSVSLHNRLVRAANGPGRQ